MLSVRVVKIGGGELDQPDWLRACARALSPLQPLVVVHGGGDAVSALCARLAVGPVEKRDGLRVTSPAVAAVVELALAGPVNRTVVAALREAGLDALGLSGVDGGVLTARAVGGELGHVGEVTAVRTALLARLLAAGLTPVLAPLAPGLEGGVPLNVNADAAAAAVAGALAATELLFVSDVAGVRVHGAVAAALGIGEVEELIALGTASDGMAVKLRAAAAALRAGARAVRIGDLRLFRDPTAGTRLLATASQLA